MAAAIENAPQTLALRCLLIAGAPNGFCAGNDISDFIKMATGEGALGAPILRFLHALARCEMPLIAAVQGNAVGVGTTMLMHCDHVVAASDARFSTPFVGLGLVPEAASSLLAPRIMGQARAFSLLVMGRPLGADDATAAGLVNTVVAANAVEAEAMKAAHEIAALPQQGMLASRRLMRGAPDEIVARIDEEAELFKTRLRSAEARAAFEAFMMRKR
jgi:enoyl-CoA hydratase/carnithine racemase